MKNRVKIRTGKELVGNDRDERQVFSLLVFENYEKIISCGADSQIRIWDMKTGLCLCKTNLSNENGFFDMIKWNTDVFLCVTCNGLLCSFRLLKDSDQFYVLEKKINLYLATSQLVKLSDDEFVVSITQVGDYCDLLYFSYSKYDFEIKKFEPPPRINVFFRYTKLLSSKNFPNCLLINSLRCSDLPICLVDIPQGKVIKYFNSRENVEEHYSKCILNYLDSRGDEIVILGYSNSICRFYNFGKHKNDNIVKEREISISTNTGLCKFIISSFILQNRYLFFGRGCGDIVIVDMKKGYNEIGRGKLFDGFVWDMKIMKNDSNILNMVACCSSGEMCGRIGTKWNLEE